MKLPRPPHSFLSAVTVFALVYVAAGAWRAWQESALEGWSALGLGWLTVERFAAERPWVPALATGLAVLLLALASARLAPLAPVRAGLGRAGHPLLASGALLAALLLPGLVARYARPKPPLSAPNVLFVLVDTWRADHAGFLGCTRKVTPELDELARQGVVFEHAISQSSWTKPSVATLLTGLLPSQHHAVSQAIPEMPVRAFQLNARLTTFIELLHGRGWQTAMWSDNPNITPPVGFGQGAESFRDYFHQPCHATDCGRIDEIVGDVGRWFDEQRDPSRPFCLYVHVMDPHYPYEPPAAYRGRFDKNPSDLQLTGPIVQDYMTGKRSQANLTPERLASLVDRYDEELLAVDHQLGAFLTRMRKEYPNTVIVLSGDHGEEFLEHKNLGHSHALWQELVHVPLVVWAPKLAPERVATQVRLMDVCPTLLDLAGVKGPRPEMQGESLLPVIAGSETKDRLAPMEVGGDQKPCWQWRGISDGTHKLLRREADLPTRHPIPPLSDEDAGERPIWYLFDLASDPLEQHNLAKENMDQARQLFAELEQRGWYVRPEELLGLRAAALALDPEQARELRNLGYGGEDEVLQSP